MALLCAAPRGALCNPPRFAHRAGIQTQTAECLVIGELTTTKLIVVLNKADLLPSDSYDATLAKLQKRLTATFAATRFAGCTQVVVSARPGGGDSMAAGGAPPPRAAASASHATSLTSCAISCAGLPAQGVEALVDAILGRVEPRRYDDPTVPLLFAVDHCFSIRCQGTILTGTVLQGQVAVGQTVELPAQRMVKKVKSMQMFRRPVTEARRGDRVGVCIAQLDASVMERGLVAEPGSVPMLSCAVRAQLPARCSRSLTPSVIRRWLPWRKSVSSRARFPRRLGSTSLSATSLLWRTSSSSRGGQA